MGVSEQREMFNSLPEIRWVFRSTHDHTLQTGHISFFGCDFEVPIDDAMR